MTLCFEGNDTGFTWVLACSPKERPQEEKNKGQKGDRPLCHGSMVFSLLSTPTLGNKTSLTTCSSKGTVNQMLVQGLGLWPKRDQAVNFPESDIRMLKESRTMSTGIAKLICESRVLMASLPNLWETLIYKRREWGQPTEGRDEGHREPWWHHLSPWNQLWQSWEKLLDFTVTWANIFPSPLELEWGRLKPKGCWVITHKTLLNIYQPQTPCFSDYLYFQNPLLWPHKTTATHAF